MWLLKFSAKSVGAGAVVVASVVADEDSSVVSDDSVVSDVVAVEESSVVLSAVDSDWVEEAVDSDWVAEVDADVVVEDASDSGVESFNCVDTVPQDAASSVVKINRAARIFLFITLSSYM